MRFADEIGAQEKNRSDSKKSLTTRQKHKSLDRSVALAKRPTRLMSPKSFRLASAAALAAKEGEDDAAKSSDGSERVTIESIATLSAVINDAKNDDDVDHNVWEDAYVGNDGNAQVRAVSIVDDVNIDLSLI